MKEGLVNGVNEFHFAQPLVKIPIMHVYKRFDLFVVASYGIEGAHV